MNIDWQDIRERALKTAVQGAVIAVGALLQTGVLHVDWTHLDLTALGVAAAAVAGAALGGALSALWNVVEDVVRGWGGRGA